MRSSGIAQADVRRVFDVNKAALRRVLYGALLLIFILRLDVWQWDDPSRVLGMPVGLTYHVGLCLAVSLVAAILVRFAWPDDLTSGDES
jgi:hypothetical protein